MNILVQITKDIRGTSALLCFLTLGLLLCSQGVLSIAAEQPKDNVSGILSLSTKTEGKTLILKGTFHHLPQPYCLTKPGKPTQNDEDIRYFKLKKYLKFAPLIDSQTISYISNNHSSFEIKLKDKIGFERTSKHHQWVLKYKLPTPIHCHSKISIPFRTNINTDLSHTRLNIDDSGNVFIVFMKNMKTHTEIIDGRPAKIYYFSDLISKLRPTIRDTYRTLSKIKSGALVEELVETDYQFSYTSNNTLLFNTSPSKAAKKFQQMALNLSEWNLTYLLVDQWLLNINADIEKHPALRLGINEFITGNILNSKRNLGHLFKSFYRGDRLFDVTYNDVTDLLFSLYERNKSVRNFDTSKDPFDAHFHKALRVALGLRAISNNLGEDKTIEKIVELLSGRVALSDKNVIKSFDSPHRPSAANILSYWLKGKKIPDLSLIRHEQTELKKGIYQHKILVDHSYVNGQLIRIELKGGKKSVSSYLKLHDKNAPYLVYTDLPIDDVKINSDHSLYELSHYNNSSSPNSVYFFPGKAKKLYSDSYTVAWVPTLSKEPSQPLKYGVSGAWFRYVWSKMNFYLIYNEYGKFDSGGVEYSNKDVFDYTDFTLNLSRPTSELSQLAASIKGRGLWGLYQPVDLTFSVSTYEENEQITRSYSSQINYSLKTKITNTTLTAFVESSPTLYEKSHIKLASMVLLPSLFSFSTQLYAGLIQFPNSISIDRELQLQTAHGFLPYDLTQARVRINDSSQLAASRIVSVSNDVKIPFALFASGVGVLGNRLYGRIFWDSALVDNGTRLNAAGLGIELPFGSDIVGGGTMIFSNLAILVGLQQKTENTADTPYVLFSFDGRL